MPLDILVPVQNALTLALPPNGDPFPKDGKGSQGVVRGGRGGGKGAMAPFEMGSSTNVTISKIFDEVEILSSLQKPKVIKILGSDGNEYSSSNTRPALPSLRLQSDVLSENVHLGRSWAFLRPA